MSDVVQKPVAILVVEDDAGDFGLVRAHARLAGLLQGAESDTLAWAKTLAEALDMVSRSLPEVVLLDLALPDSSGIATVEAMHAAVPAVPIVVLTGNDDHAQAAAALLAGAQDYLVKGHFEHYALGRAIRHAVVRKQLELGLAQTQERLELALSGADLGLWDWDFAQIFTARASSAVVELRLTSRVSLKARVSSASTCASDSLSEIAGSPIGTSKPLVQSIQTSLMLLARIVSMSFGSVITKLVRQKGCSIQEPQNSLMCMPTVSWWTPIRLSIALVAGRCWSNFQSIPISPDGQKKRPAGLFFSRSPMLYRPASARSAAALSVASQVNSGSSRPKWP